MTAVYDAGALIAADRGDRQVWAEHRALLEAHRIPKTTAPVVAQVVRSGQQVGLGRFVGGCDVVPFEAEDTRPVGRVLAVTATADVVDAHLAVVASRSGNWVLSDDVTDLRILAAALDPSPTIHSL